MLPRSCEANSDVSHPELYARHGDSDKMKKQESVNRVLERTLERQVYRRGIPSPLFPEIGCTPPAKPSGRLTNHFHKPGKTISRGCVAAAEKDGDSGMGESVISVDEEDEVRMQLDG